MRQVPKNGMAAPSAVSPRYAILGNGRLARHLRFYFSSLNLPFTAWSRCGTPQANTFAEITHPTDRLERTLNHATVVLVALSDAAIVPFLQQNATATNAHGKPLYWVHFAASVDAPQALCAHPLMTFADALYDADFYPCIAFACDDPARFRTLFPVLSNPVFALVPDQRPLYHALCVMAGNFPQLLWHSCHLGLNQLGVPSDAVAMYLRQISENFIRHPDTALTGPLVRGDAATCASHRKQLQASDPALAELYAAFERFFHQCQQAQTSNAAAKISFPDTTPGHAAHEH